MRQIFWKNGFCFADKEDVMDIRFEKREVLKEKPDQKHLGFGKYMTDYMFVMDWTKEDGWKDARIVPEGQSLWILPVLHFTTHRRHSRKKAYRTAEGKDPVIPSGNECKENDQFQCKTLYAGVPG